MIKDHGIFRIYNPADRSEMTPDVGFCRNENSIDWYVLQKTIEPGAALVEVDPVTGRILGKTGDTDGNHDYSTRWPCDKRLLEIRPASEADDLTYEMRYNGAGFEPVPPPPRSALFKTEIYSRMTDEELEAFEAALAVAPVRLRLMWRDCNSVEVESPLFPMLRQQLTEGFSEARAAAILSLDP